MAAPPPQHVNAFFRLAIVSGGAFVVAILASVSVLFGDPASPANRFIDRNAGWLFAATAFATVAFGILGMIVDRRQTRRYEDDRPTPRAPDADDGRALRPPLQ